MQRLSLLCVTASLSEAVDTVRSLSEAVDAARMTSANRHSSTIWKDNTLYVACTNNVQSKRAPALLVVHIRYPCEPTEIAQLATAAGAIGHNWRNWSQLQEQSLHGSGKVTLKTRQASFRWMEIDGGQGGDAGDKIEVRSTQAK